VPYLEIQDGRSHHLENHLNFQFIVNLIVTQKICQQMSINSLYVEKGSKASQSDIQGGGCRHI
jgi:hypothetical protein